MAPAAVIGHSFFNRRVSALTTSVVIFLTLFVFFFIVAGIERLTDPPAMRRRMNAGSDDFLRERRSLWQAAEGHERNAWRYRSELSPLPLVEARRSPERQSGAGEH